MEPVVEVTDEGSACTSTRDGSLASRGGGVASVIVKMSTCRAVITRRTAVNDSVLIVHKDTGKSSRGSGSSRRTHGWVARLMRKVASMTKAPRALFPVVSDQ